MSEKTNTLDWLKLDEEDYALVEGVADIESFSSDRESDALTPQANESEVAQPDSKGIIRILSSAMVAEDPETFCRFVAVNRKGIYEAAYFDEDVIRVLLIGYKIGISERNGTSANALGAMYYLGGALVGQDYDKAEHLYKMAMRWGCDQAIINLGYIYEYGRTGGPDYAKAYQYYSLAAALTQKSEALYKLGDMYSRGRTVQKDEAMALQLWEKSLEEAQGVSEVAQPAIRLAPIYLEGPEDCGVEQNALLALDLYQKAEVGQHGLDAVVRGAHVAANRASTVSGCVMSNFWNMASPSSAAMTSTTA